jgi:hypothetical protein
MESFYYFLSWDEAANKVLLLVGDAGCALVVNTECCCVSIKLDGVAVGSFAALHGSHYRHSLDFSDVF